MNNFLRNNADGSSQAFDNGTHNTFKFNFWDDWRGPENNADGIVDIPYLIDGNAGSYDFYPNADPVPSPTSGLVLTHSVSS